MMFFRLTLLTFARYPVSFPPILQSGKKPTSQSSTPFPHGLLICRFIAIVCSSLVILLLATFPGWHEEMDENGSERDVKPFPSRPVSRVACVLAVISAILLLLSSLWQHVAAVAYTTGVVGLASSTVKTDLGTTSMVFLWISFASMTIVGHGLVVMVLSISLLDRLTDEDSIRPVARGSLAGVQQTFQPEPVPMRNHRWDDGDE